jgi:hypothetical protein
MSGSVGSNAPAAELRRIVVAKIVFFSHASAASNSRPWACFNIARNFERVALSCVLLSLPVLEWSDRLVTKRLKIGKDWGTTVAWQGPVARIVAKMWRTQAWRSVLIIAGKTWEASTRAERAVLRRETASSLSS